MPGRAFAADPRNLSPSLPGRMSRAPVTPTATAQGDTAGPKVTLRLWTLSQVSTPRAASCR